MEKGDLALDLTVGAVVWKNEQKVCRMPIPRLAPEKLQLKTTMTYKALKLQLVSRMLDKPKKTRIRATVPTDQKEGKGQNKGIRKA